MRTNSVGGDGIPQRDAAGQSAPLIELLLDGLSDTVFGIDNEVLDRNREFHDRAILLLVGIPLGVLRKVGQIQVCRVSALTALPPGMRLPSVLDQVASGI